MKLESKNQLKSFTVLVRPHLDKMYRLAYRLAGNREDAQDVVQDVLLKLCSQLDRLREVDAIGSWLSRVVYHQFIDNQRKYASHRLRIVGTPELGFDPDSAAAPQPSTEELVEGEFTITRLQAALDQLSDNHRLIINLHDVEGHTLPEIAEITGIPLGTLKSRRHRARERLQKLLYEGPDQASPTSKQHRGEKNDELRPVPPKPGSFS